MEIPTNQTPQQNQQEVNRSPVPNTKGKGLFGLLFIGVIIVSTFILLLVVLNYFNVLKLSVHFPSFLGFLPSKDAPNGGSQSLKIEKNSTRQGFPTPIASLTEEAKKALIKILPSIITSSLIPSDSLIPVAPIEIEKNGFRAEWKIGESSVYAKFQLSSNSAILNYVQIGVTSPNSFASSAETAEKATSEFFSISTQGKWKCQKINDSIYCENFWQDKSDAKRRVYLNSPLETTNTRKDSSIFYCESHKDSSGSYPFNGCISALE